MRDLNRKAFLKTKGKNLEHVRELKRQSFVRRNENNPDHVKELNKNAQKRKRFQSTQLHTNDLELLQPAKKKQNCTVADETHEMKMANVIQSFHDSINCGPEYICTCCDQLWYRS